MRVTAHVLKTSVSQHLKGATDKGRFVLALRRRDWLLAIYCLCFAAFFSVQTAAHAQNSLITPAGDQMTVTLACNPFPPSKIADAPYEPGYDVEILRAAFATRNITLITPFYPWKRAYFLARTGQVDGLCSCSYLPERENDFLFSDLLGNVRVAVYAIQQEALDIINTIEDAHSMTIGVVNGYSLEASARDAGIDLIMANSEATLVNLLLSRRLDAVLSFKSPMDYLIKNRKDALPDVSLIKTKIIADNPYYSCITRNIKNSQGLMTQLNIGLKTIRENGLYENILAKYGVTADNSPHSLGQNQ